MNRALTLIAGLRCALLPCEESAKAYENLRRRSGFYASTPSSTGNVARMGDAPEEIRLKTSDGLELEAQLAIPPEPRAAAVLTHPLPTHGGNMRSIVPGALFAALPVAGIAALRFNFRGIGNSEGAFEDGPGERLDVLAALDTLHPVVEGLPLVLAGWSFGADTILTVEDPRVSGWVAVAPPLRDGRQPTFTVTQDPRPKLLLVPERDEFRNPEQVRAVTHNWRNTSMVVIPGADHFLVGRTDRVVEEVQAFVEGLVGAS